jgi:alpha-D-ribose 1-methylphosphonate 5-triphosphate diphosphatase PhnM
MHKNLYLKNKWMFINDYKEVKGYNSKGDIEKIMYVIKATNVLDYKNCHCFIHFECQLKFTQELKIKQAHVKINDIEITKLKTNNSNDGKFSLQELKVSFFSIYNKFKLFMSELKALISDLEYLNSI